MGNLFKELAQGLQEAAAIQRGDLDPKTYRVHVPAEVDVKAIRSRMGMTQAAFADRFGLKLATVRDWEQARVTPEPMARVLLTVISREPEAVLRALS